ncbi:outer membrane beta-barrel protein [Tellurirhabdus rosea]|uniref:outer membrane beta-barrel protein n=1 Tax=Tellurirhabdus rosea TaxID=2674997 RepID=UPI00224E2D01|nr:outer membrane beta-barrel protein [Tellurirhabdus rosea]
MKKVLSALFVLCSLSAATAQEFKPFKVNTSVGYAKPSGPGASGGLLASVEPKYGWNEFIDFGFRIEGALMARALVVDGQTSESEIKAMGSYLLTTNLLFTDTYVKPYVGIGAGLYRTAGMGISVVEDGEEEPTGEMDVQASNKFGGMIRAGLKIGHFVLGAEYNLVPATKYSLSTGEAVKGNNSYLGIKLGFDIGGGK